MHVQKPEQLWGTAFPGSCILTKVMAFYNHQGCCLTLVPSNYLTNACWMSHKTGKIIVWMVWGPTKVYLDWKVEWQKGAVFPPSPFFSFLPPHSFLALPSPNLNPLLNHFPSIPSFTLYSPLSSLYPFPSSSLFNGVLGYNPKKTLIKWMHTSFSTLWTKNPPCNASGFVWLHWLVKVVEHKSLMYFCSRDISHSCIFAVVTYSLLMLAIAWCKFTSKLFYGFIHMHFTKGHLGGPWPPVSAVEGRVLLVHSSWPLCLLNGNIVMTSPLAECIEVMVDY
jgi:hypothetical protein